MTKLPLITVHPLRACAAVTESTVFSPMHTLGQRPAQGVQFNLRHKTQSHMYTKPHDKQKSLIHTCCEQNTETKKRRYDRVFLLSLTLKQICSIRTVTDCLCQGRGSCCAKCQHWEQGRGVTLQGRPRVQSRMNETFSQTCQRHRLITDCFCRYLGHD